MKHLIFIFNLFFITIFISCEEEKELVINVIKIDSIQSDYVVVDEVMIDSIQINEVVIDTTLLMYREWERINSTRNDTSFVLRTDFVDMNDELMYFHHSYNLFANDYGLYSFDFSINQRQNTFTSQYEYFDSTIVQGGYINMYSIYLGDENYKIENLNDSLLTLSYVSIFNNDVTIILTPH